jgi:hypothetical protein
LGSSERPGISASVHAAYCLEGVWAPAQPGQQDSHRPVVVRIPRQPRARDAAVTLQDQGKMRTVGVNHVLGVQGPTFVIDKMRKAYTLALCTPGHRLGCCGQQRDYRPSSRSRKVSLLAPPEDSGGSKPSDRMAQGCPKGALERRGDPGLELRYPTIGP